MTNEEIMRTLLRARPIEDSGNEMVTEIHEKAVKRAEMLIKDAEEPYLMSVLVDRYLKGMTFKEIAIERKIGVSTAHRFHGMAIERIKDVKNGRKRKRNNQS